MELKGEAKLLRIFIGESDKLRHIPLYEVIDGEFHLSRKVAKPKPITEYFKPQRRFRHLTEAEVQYIQDKVDADYEKLLKKCVVEEKKKEKE